MLFVIRVPAALPALGAGLRVAAAGAPLGAIVGEWVGASSGLGLLMLHANARMQTDMVFAGLTVLVVFSVTLWAAVGALTRRLIHWAPDTLAPLTNGEE
jgi:putative hydroxymethylpyrimidine transport system permease protein